MDSASPEAFAERLRAAMIANGLSKSQLTQQAQVDRMTVHRLLGVCVTQGQRKRGPFLDTVTKLAAALNVRPAWLGWGELPMRPPVPSTATAPSSGEEVPSAAA